MLAGLLRRRRRGTKRKISRQIRDSCLPLFIQTANRTASAEKTPNIEEKKKKNRKRKRKRKGELKRRRHRLGNQRNLCGANAASHEFGWKEEVDF